MADKKFNPVFAENRKARHDYTVLETIECGIVLTGTEVKSVRHGEVSLSGSYGAVLKGELWRVGADIAAYKLATASTTNRSRCASSSSTQRRCATSS